MGITGSWANGSVACGIAARSVYPISGAASGVDPVRLRFPAPTDHQELQRQGRETAVLLNLLTCRLHLMRANVDCPVPAIKRAVENVCPG